jgi:hypothetical protein
MTLIFVLLPGIAGGLVGLAVFRAIVSGAATLTLWGYLRPGSGAAVAAVAALGASLGLIFNANSIFGA